MDNGLLDCKISHINFKITPIKLELLTNWKLSRSEDLFKTNYILEAIFDDDQILSEIAPNLRYNETKELINNNFNALVNMSSISLTDVASSRWCQSFKSAVSNCLLKILAKENKKSLPELLGLKVPRKVLTSYSLPIMDIKEVRGYLEHFNQFDVYKIKIKDSSSLAFLEEVSKYTQSKLRIDANEGFTSLEDYLKFEAQILKMNIEFIEQPFCASKIELYRRLKPISKYEIIADESIIFETNLKLIASQFHGVNIKQMKAGGIYSSFKLLNQAKEEGLKLMLGCMIESSLAISEVYELAALCDYCDLDGSLLLKNDPYSNLIQNDGSYIIKKGCN